MKSDERIEMLSEKATVIISDKESLMKVKFSTTTLSEPIKNDISYKVALSPNNLIGLSITFLKDKSENSPMNVNDSAVIFFLNHPSLSKNNKKVSLVKL